MEHLTKQQIVLLTLLVSFVTSIATGIVTVALMDQAPTGVTSTINHVIERTIEQVTPSDGSNGATAITSVMDPQTQVADALAVLQHSIVTIKLATGMDASGATVGSTTGIGLVVSKAGAIITDKAAVALVGAYVAILPNGKTVPVAITQSQTNGDLVFLSAQISPAAAANSGIAFTPAILAAGLPKLGQTVLSLFGADSPTLAQGIMTNVSQDSFVTSIDSSKSTTTSVLFDTSGEVIGLQAISGTLYPVSVIKSAIPAVH